MLIDDIAYALDDVALLTKVATKKTAGVLGDDLALNAQQVTGVTSDREWPVVLAVAKGSIVNKAILVPAALGISALAPWAVTPLLMIGGAFLCYEGVEKLVHKFLHDEKEEEARRAAVTNALLNPEVDFVALEKDKIKGAIRTDFVLSAEIITITLGTVANADFMTRVVVLVAIALIMTIGVYGLVAGIVKIDDIGLYLSRKQNAGSQRIGRGLLKTAPYLMKTLSIAGTIAMFLVGGGIVTHGIPSLHHWIEEFSHHLGGFFGALASPVIDAIVGVLVGAVIVAVVMGAKKVFAKPHQPKAG
jgi:predicted DNA repair protein MutK